MKARRHHWLIGGIVVVIALLICVIVLNREGLERERTSAIGESILERLHTGMTREEVDRVLGAHVEWRCRRNLANGSEEVYLIGNRNPNLAFRLYLRFEIIDSQEALTYLGTIDISMFSYSEDCPPSAK